MALCSRYRARSSTGSSLPIKNIPHQQNLSKFNIAIVILAALIDSNRSL